MEKLNIAELLKDCPKGMELDCVMYDGLEFDRIDERISPNYSIVCRVKTESGQYNFHTFTKYGSYSRESYSKCVIFPKGKTTWEGFQRPFKEGDVLYIDCNDDGDTYKWNQYIFILKNISKGRIDAYCYINGTNESKFKICYLADLPYHPRFATEEEKQKLFDAIKANGYKWNEENKTLEKLIEPKFKVGDRIRNKKYPSETYFIVGINETKYDVGNPLFIDFKSQDYWELIPNKFDITTLKPFDKVLVRHSDTDYWKPAFWGKHITSQCSPFISSHGFTAQAIPFKGNEWLVGTTDNCDEYYKTWE